MRFDRNNLRKVLLSPLLLTGRVASVFVRRDPKLWVFGSGIGFGEGASATLTPGGLLVTNTAAELDKIETLVNSMANLAPKQVKITTKFVEITQENSDELGWDTSLFIVYHYSEDVTVRLQYSRFWVGDGAAEGAFTYNNGLIFNGGVDDKDADFIAAEMSVKF